MLKNFPLSKKQVLSFQESDARVNIWEGAVRSGKTFVSILKLLDRIKYGISGSVMIIGVSRETIQRNVLVDLYRLLGFAPPSSKVIHTVLYKRDIYFVGADNESAVRKIRGTTLAYAYVDEAAQLPKAFWRMLLSRISLKGAQLFATCNPEGSAHWLKKDFLDNKKNLSLKNWKFTLNDNPSLDPTYVKYIKREYGKGVFYKRYILGQWTLAEGLVYDSMDNDNLHEVDDERPDYRICGIDYGTYNPTAVVLIGIYSKKWPQIRIIDEYYYDSRVSGYAKTCPELADDLEEFLKYRSVRSIYIDPSAGTLKELLRSRGLTILDANNDVLNGIRVTSKFISQKNISIHKYKCKKLLESLHSYVWDPKSLDLGLDRPLKEHDHAADALRYAIYSAFPRGEISNRHDNSTIGEIRKLVYGEEPYLNL